MISLRKSGSAQCLILLIISVWTGTTSTFLAQPNIFCCPLEENYYSMRTNDQLFSVKTAQYRKPFKTQDMGTYMEVIEDVYTKFLSSRFKSNSIGNFIRFYDAYSTVKDCPNFPGFQSFFRQYKDKIRPDEEPVGNILNLMKQYAALKIFQDNRRSLYLITASPFDSAKYNPEIDKPYEIHTPTYWKYQHVAGIIYFSCLNGQGRERYGYVLLDPKYLKKPVAFMEDGGSLPFHHQFSEDVGNPEEKLPSVQIQWSAKDSNETRKVENSLFVIGEYKQDGQHVEISYYFKAPYCSFVEHTLKPSLLRMDHKTEMFNENNEMVASVYVTFNPFKDTNGMKATFSLRTPAGWRSQIFPSSKAPRDTESEMKAISASLADLCKALHMYRRFFKPTCVGFWIDRIKKLNTIGSDKEFLNLARDTLDLYKSKNSTAKNLPTNRPVQFVSQETDSDGVKIKNEHPSESPLESARIHLKRADRVPGKTEKLAPLDAIKSYLHCTISGYN